jgi:hypothetical protein
MSAYTIQLLGILVALGLLIFMAFRGVTLLLAAPAAALVAAAFSGEPLLAKWTLTFMQDAANFVRNLFPLFLLGGVFGKLMDDSGAALSIARTITDKLGETRAIMAVVLYLVAATWWASGCGGFAGRGTRAPLAGLQRRGIAAACRQSAGAREGHECRQLRPAELTRTAIKAEPSFALSIAPILTYFGQPRHEFQSCRAWTPGSWRSRDSIPRWPP